jgi:carboxymethylenebutenolidase
MRGGDVPTTSRRIAHTSFTLLACALAAACTTHADAANDSAAAAPASVSSDSSLAPGSADAQARLAASPRHGEWVMIAAPGTSDSPANDSVRAWVVYPERSTKAPVVLVVHEIFGMSTWGRAVADQLAADGFIAIAPDLLTAKHLSDRPDSVDSRTAVAAIRTLSSESAQKQLDAVAKYGMSLPAALPRYGIVGFCWGGTTVLQHAVHSPSVSAVVAYYGTSPKTSDLTNVRAPILGLYGGEDMRVDATSPAMDSAMKAMDKVYEHFVFDGAGHGFLRAQDGHDGANRAAAEAAWPKTIAWFRKYLENSKS